MEYHSRTRCKRLGALLATLALLLAGAVPAAGAVILEGAYRISAPEPSEIRFRLLLTPTGAQLTPSSGETLVFSYAEKSALVLDHRARSYFVLPLELVPLLLAEGLGYDPRQVRASASGKTKRLLGESCAEVVASGNSPGVTLRTWRVTDPAWNREYDLLERAIGMPWTAGPDRSVGGVPLAGTVAVEGRIPYRAAWEVTRISRDPRAEEDFSAPEGYRMDLEGLLSLQRKKR